MLFWDIYLVWIMINQTVDIQVSQALQSFILVFGSINPGLLTLFLIHIRANGKVQPYSLGLLGFYTLKFEKLDFTLWSLVQLAKSHPRLIWQLSDTSSCWHVFFFAKLAWSPFSQNTQHKPDFNETLFHSYSQTQNPTNTSFPNPFYKNFGNTVIFFSPSAPLITDKYYVLNFTFLSSNFCFH